MEQQQQPETDTTAATPERDVLVVVDSAEGSLDEIKGDTCERKDDDDAVERADSMDNRRPGSDGGADRPPKRTRTDASRPGRSYARPSFLPADLCVPASSDSDVRAAKRMALEAYLDLCSKYADPAGRSSACEKASFVSHSFAPADVAIAEEEEEEEENVWERQEDTPTETAFYRDDQLVVLNDGPDGLSTDYLVASVFRNVWITLKRFTACSDTVTTMTASTGKTFRDTLRGLERDVRDLRSRKEPVAKRYSRILAMIKNLVLAVDTSKGGNRKFVVNQMNPVTCYLPNLTKLCCFNGFGTVNDWGYLECNFNVPVKLVFLGTLNKQQYECAASGDSNLVYRIEPTRYFGSYFYAFLERLYRTCFQRLRAEVLRYKKNKVTREARYSYGVAELNRGSMTSLVRSTAAADRSVGGDAPGGIGGGVSYWDPSALDGFFDRLPDLVPRDDIRIVGTTGGGNSQRSLRYTRYCGDERKIAEADPEEDSDAVFVSSFIRFRIREDGGVHMDVFTRNAVQLEVDESTEHGCVCFDK